MTHAMVYKIKLNKYEPESQVIYTTEDKGEWHITNMGVDGHKIIDEISKQISGGLHQGMNLAEVLVKMFGNDEYQCIEKHKE